MNRECGVAARFSHHATLTSGKSDFKGAVNFYFTQVHQLQAENVLPIPPSRKLGLQAEIRRRLLFLAVAALNILPSAHIRRGEEEGGRRYKPRDSSAHIRTHTHAAGEEEEEAAL